MTTRRPFRRITWCCIGAFATLGHPVQVSAAESQSDVVFDMLGPAVCELPPPGFDARRLAQIAAGDPDTVIALGRIEGALTGRLVGGGAYGQDDAGGFVLSVQGATIDSGGDAPTLCLLLVRIGTSTALSGTVVGEDRIDGAPDGAFLGLFRLVWTDSDGKPAIVATGWVDEGRVHLVKDDAGVVDGEVIMTGRFSMPGDDELLPIAVEIAVPHAENVIRPALRLHRDVLDGPARRAVAAGASSNKSTSAPLHATFRIPSNFPQIPLSWSAVPLDGGAGGVSWVTQSEMVVAEGLFKPGRYEVSTIGPGEVAFRAEVLIAPGQSNDFIVPLVIERED